MYDLWYKDNNYRKNYTHFILHGDNRTKFNFFWKSTLIIKCMRHPLMIRLVLQKFHF